MNVEVVGVGFHNKGAELMLCAIAQHFREHPHTSLAAGPFVNQGGDAGRYGLLRKLDTAFIGRSGRLFDMLTPKPIRQLYGFLPEREIDAVLDASGFFYADQWGPAGTERRAHDFAKWKRQGKKIVLLPQAFGPFKIPGLRKAFATVLENVDLVFAREQQSYDHIAGIGARLDHVEIAPDFTNVVHGVLPAYLQVNGNSACIIPNKRMVDKTAASVSERYIGFLAFCFRYLEEAGMNPFVLLHEAGDQSLAETLEKELRRPLRLLQEDDPVFIKGILGACYLVVGSRYHGLVSALSQGVPCVGSSWSHKYETLFESYGCPDLLVETLDDYTEVKRKIRAITEEPGRSTVTGTLRAAAAEQKEATRRMWSQVDSTLFM